VQSGSKSQIVEGQKIKGIAGGQKKLAVSDAQGENLLVLGGYRIDNFQGTFRNGRPVDFFDVLEIELAGKYLQDIVLADNTQFLEDLAEWLF
jgi:hypothetical protein